MNLFDVVSLLAFVSFMSYQFGQIMYIKKQMKLMRIRSKR